MDYFMMLFGPLELDSLITTTKKIYAWENLYEDLCVSQKKKKK